MTFASAAIVTLLVAGPLAQTQTPPPPPPTTPPVGQQTAPPPGTQRPTTPAPALPTPPKPVVPFPEGAKIAFVSLAGIVAESKLGKEGSEQMKKFYEKESAPLVVLQKKITDLENEINSQRNVLTPEALQAKGRNLDSMKRQLQYDSNELQAKVGEFNGQLVKGLETKVLPIIDALRNEKGLWVILADQGDGQQAGGLSVVSFHPGLDLTAEIIKRLDAVTPSVGGK
jgi:Skp family chaperone for outer membrane proteins